MIDHDDPGQRPLLDSRRFLIRVGVVALGAILIIAVIGGMFLY